jgi:hypothetical protein
MNGSTLLLGSLTSFYQKNPDKRAVLYEIVTGDSLLSLRVIDWFVTHYAKAFNIVYWIDDTEKRLYEQPVAGSQFRKFNVYLDTRAQLKSYTKLHFDPFRRHERISFVLENEPYLKVIETTVGQLNFFRWALQNHLLEYIQNHLADIEDHMATYQKKSTPSSGGSTVTPNTVMKAHCCVRFD